MAVRWVMGAIFGALLVACPSGTDTVETGDVPPLDTDTPPEDTGMLSPRLGAVTGRVTVPEGAVFRDDVVVGVVGITFGDGPDIEETVALTSLADADTHTLALDALPDSVERIELESSAYPGLMGAMFMVLAFVDEDGNGRFVPGEQIVGGSLSRLLLWAEGELPSGVVHGWNIVDTGLSGSYETGNCLLDTTNPLIWRSSYNADYPQFYGLDEPVDINLLGLAASVQVAGTVDGLAVDDRLALVPYQTLYGDKTEEPLRPLAELALLDEAFSMDFSTPMDEAYDISPDPSWGYGLSFGVVYQDLNGDAGYTPGEESSDASLCANNSLAALRYTAPVADYRGWRLMECYQIPAGWRVVTRQTDGTWVRVRTDKEAASLVVDATRCSF